EKGLDAVVAAFLRECNHYVQREVSGQGSLASFRNPSQVCCMRIRDAVRRGKETFVQQLGHFVTIFCFFQKTKQI
ncbi:unnamed protein product, partial [Polarella glacialis]